jgi:hypothetical protein
MVDVYEAAVMFGLLDWFKIGAGVAAGAIVGGALFYTIGHWRGDADGYARYAAEQTAATLQAEKKRNSDDAELQRMSDYDFCVQSLGARELPIDACNVLRRVESE